ncbi:MAG: ATP-binding protein, partial [Polyangiaceae bacterium]
MDSFLVAQQKVLEHVASGAPLPDVLDEIALLVERQVPGMMASILLFDAKTRSLEHMAAPNLPREYVSAIDGCPIGPDVPTWGAAAYARQPVVSEDIAADPSWDGQRELALRHGLRACWSTAILSPAGELLGTFTMYYRERRRPGSQELECVTQATYLASIAMLCDRAGRMVRGSEARIAKAEAQHVIDENAVRLRLLGELGEAMRTAVLPDDILPAAIDLLGRHLHVARCSYTVIEADGERCTVLYDYTDGAPSLAGEQFFLSGVGKRIPRAFRQGEAPLVVSDVERDLPSEERGPFESLGIRALICSTLVRHGPGHAMIAVHSATPRNWEPAEVAIVEEFAARCRATIEQRDADDRLRRSEALLRIASRAAKLGAFSIELPDFRVTWSDEACAIYGVPPGSMPTLQEAFEFWAPEWRETVRESVANCALDATPFDHELEIITAKGARIWARAVGHAERGPDGTISRVTGAIQDVSERRRLEQQLNQAQKMEAIGQLAGSVAHDFNNLLSVILSYALLTQESLKPGDPLLPDIEEIFKAAERASDLTRQLLAFSRQQMRAPRVVDLNAVVGGMQKMLRRVVGDDVNMSLLNGTNLGKVMADPGQIEQVVMNLVVNARDAMPSGGNITIETLNADIDEPYAATHHNVTPGPYVLLAVTDTGVGMNAETRARVFEPFFTTKEMGKGTGLGLATVWGIVQQSGGHVWVYSEPGRGTTFKLYFPRVDREVEEVAVDNNLAPPQRGSETVLLVEDE